MNEEFKNQVSKYVQLSATVCSDLMAENEHLLNEKEALEQQVEQSKEAEEEDKAVHLDTSQVERVVSNLKEAGFISEGEQKQAQENIQSDPNVLLQFVDKVAQSELNSGQSQIGDVADTSETYKSDKSDRESNEVFLSNFG